MNDFPKLPLVSVINPVFHAADTVSEAIVSDKALLKLHAVGWIFLIKRVVYQANAPKAGISVKAVTL